MSQVSIFLLKFFLQYSTNLPDFFDRLRNFVGWGKDAFKGKLSDDLLEASVIVKTPQDCRKTYDQENM